MQLYEFHLPLISRVNTSDFARLWRSIPAGRYFDVMTIDQPNAKILTWAKIVRTVVKCRLIIYLFIYLSAQ